MVRVYVRIVVICLFLKTLAMASTVRPNFMGMVLEQTLIENKINIVKDFSLKKYMGLWHEVARLPNKFQRDCLGGATAEYSVDEDGNVKVVNTCFDEEGKKINDIVGKAKFRTKDKTIGALKVSFFWIFYGDYNIVYLDKNYSYALVVGSNPNKYLWILARDKRVNKKIINKLLDYAKDEMGVNISRVIIH